MHLDSMMVAYHVFFVLIGACMKYISRINQYGKSYDRRSLLRMYLNSGCPK